MSAADDFFVEYQSKIKAISFKVAYSYLSCPDDAEQDIYEWLSQKPDEFFRENTTSFVLQGCSNAAKQKARELRYHGMHARIVEMCIADLLPSEYSEKDADFEHESSDMMEYLLEKKEESPVMANTTPQTEAQMDLQIDVALLVAELSTRDQVIVDGFMRGLKAKEISSNLGIAESGITKRKKIIERVLDPLRAYLN